LNELSNLQELVQRELARRAAATAARYAPERVVIDGGPDDDSKLAAMEAKYPGKIIIVREIVDSPMRRSPRRRTAPARCPWPRASTTTSALASGLRECRLTKTPVLHIDVRQSGARLHEYRLLRPRIHPEAGQERPRTRGPACRQPAFCRRPRLRDKAAKKAKCPQQGRRAVSSTYRGWVTNFWPARPAARRCPRTPGLHWMEHARGHDTAWHADTTRQPLAGITRALLVWFLPGKPARRRWGATPRARPRQRNRENTAPAADATTRALRCGS
jgi:hypothetical protein